MSVDKLGPMPSLHVVSPSLAINLGEGVNGDDGSSISTLTALFALLIPGGSSLFLVLIIASTGLGENRMPLPSLLSLFCL